MVFVICVGGGGSRLGFSSALFKIFANFIRAFLVVSPPSRLVAVFAGGDVKSVMRSVADCRKQSSKVTFGNGISWGGNSSVSVSRTARVLGIKHFRHR